MAEYDTKYYSNKQEKMVAKALGGYPVGGSGAMPAVPGDVKTYDWLVECKTHVDSGQKITFNFDVWTKIEKEAMAVHRKPVLIVDDGSQNERFTWCLCRSNNLNLSAFVTVPFPVAIRKNIICQHEKMRDALKEGTKQYAGLFYEGGVFEVDWNGTNVIVLPLVVFKEIFEK